MRTLVDAWAVVTFLESFAGFCVLVPLLDTLEPIDTLVDGLAIVSLVGTSAAGDLVAVASLGSSGTG